MLTNPYCAGAGAACAGWAAGAAAGSVGAAAGATCAGWVTGSGFSAARTAASRACCAAFSWAWTSNRLWAKAGTPARLSAIKDMQMRAYIVEESPLDLWANLSRSGTGWQLRAGPG